MSEGKANKVEGKVQNAIGLSMVQLALEHSNDACLRIAVDPSHTRAVTFKSRHPVTPIVPGLSGKSKALFKSLHHASDLDPTTDVLLLEEMIINHLAQMISVRRKVTAWLLDLLPC